MVQTINNTVDFVKRTLSKAEGGHDWWHIYRVWQLSKQIASKEENVNLTVVELGALLHDIADSKFYDGDEEIGPRLAAKFLKKENVEDSVVEHVINIIRNISFKNSFEDQTFSSKELDIVQDADRLDAIGAIGIARTFNYGGHKGRALYDPAIKPEENLNKETYKKSTAPTINHFYEKLLLLKDKMNTKTGKEMAVNRHKFMEQYLKEFFDEWEGIK
jgi:uncharacterized protein